MFDRITPALRPLTLLALAAAAAALSGCIPGLSCNDVYIADRFSLTLNDRPAGDERWIVDITADGELACSLEIGRAELVDGMADEANGCAGWGTRFELEGDGMRVELPDFTPSHVDVRLRIDGAPAGQMEMEPQYASEDHVDACQTSLETAVFLEVQRPL